MNARNNTRLVGCATVLAFSLSGLQIWGQVDISVPVRHSDLSAMTAWEGEESAERFAAPIERWRGEAVELLEMENESGRAARDFRHLVNGVRYKDFGEGLPQGFITSMDEMRLEALFRAGRVSAGRSREDAMARELIARSVIDRSMGGELYSEARLELAVMISILSDSSGAALEELKDILRDSMVTSVARGKAAAYQGAFSGPKTVADFAAAREVLDLSIQYYARQQSYSLSHATLQRLRQDGVDYLAPAAFGGDETPLRTVARAAYDLYDLDLLVRIHEFAQKARVSQEGFEEITYWTGLVHQATNQYPEAIEYFALVADTASDSYYAALCSVRLGQCYHGQRKYFEAAVIYLDTSERFGRFEDIYVEVIGSFDLLVKTGRLDDVRLVQSKVNQLVRERQISMAGHRLEVDVK